MNNDILLDDLARFQEKYAENSNNTKIEQQIRDCGITRASINQNKNTQFEFKFNIEVPETRIYNQLHSHQCNIYAFLRVVKDILRQRHELDVERLSLSANYINFFDKLEKANTLYTDLIYCHDLSLEKLNQKVNRYIGSFGTFHFCREIVNKYGLVPTSAMSELTSNYDDALAIELLRAKIKSDATALIGQSEAEKQDQKNKLMHEVYQFLAKVYGHPPANFEFKAEIITPQEFKTQYLGNALDEYVTVTSFKKEALLESYAFTPNVYLTNNETILELPTNQIEHAIVRQLQDNISVWFSAEESTTLDYTDNVLDDKLYDFGKMLNIKDIDKNEKMRLDLINYDHAMCITGALVEHDKIKQFKVDNSFGRHGKYKGRLIMTTPFFENYVITSVIDRKYLV